MQCQAFLVAAPAIRRLQPPICRFRREAIATPGQRWREGKRDVGVGLWAVRAGRVGERSALPHFRLSHEPDQRKNGSPKGSPTKAVAVLIQYNLVMEPLEASTGEAVIAST